MENRAPVISAPAVYMLLAHRQITSTLYLNVLLVLKKRSFHNVPQIEGFALHVEAVFSKCFESLPMSLLHGWIGHHL